MREGTMTRREILLLGLGIGGTLLGCATIAPPADVPAKKLIEFGWDEPDAAFMRRHIDQMEQHGSPPAEDCPTSSSRSAASR